VRTAWRDQKNEDIAATIVGYIRQLALGSPLMPYAERVDRAVQRLRKAHKFTDPAVGTGGFLINADRYVRSLTDDYHDLPVAKQNFQRREAFYGVELVPDVQRLALMNAMLHDIEGDIVLGDTLGPTGARLPKADVILTNPPFGTKKGGGAPTCDDITFPTSNKQLVFLQHAYRGLKAGGRAAIVLPDNVLFEEGVGPSPAPLRVT